MYEGLAGLFTEDSALPIKLPPEIAIEGSTFSYPGAPETLSVAIGSLCGSDDTCSFRMETAVITKAIDSSMLVVRSADVR